MKLKNRRAKCSRQITITDFVAKFFDKWKYFTFFTRSAQDSSQMYKVDQSDTLQYVRIEIKLLNKEYTAFSISIKQGIEKLPSLFLGIHSLVSIAMDTNSLLRTKTLRRSENVGIHC
ncbi:hypothetical protein T4B_4444 [Trichinella pseudospiralis]|uniref:Uncharacterized protein n=1 Tax=Trichinella pseudospiralis TaxID=6337 RepID=A0A0V1JP27_TRIPS|nr:hypothetical protein T4A_13739 [Trichinella pseudospiralis]KRZ11663.1 hypothetical protein T4B_4444 [Trichinella pseudospiralis]KRZ36710.1 hypothetical protein T4C_7543 [Trichinella pseudospiralis]